MFDESLLDHPDALARADTAGLLRGTAAAGARVRTAARLAAEAGVAALRPDGRPRTVLLAGPGGTPARLAALLGALAGCPVLTVDAAGPAPDGHQLRWTLPGWAGSADLLLLTTGDGTEPGLSHLAEQAYRHGCSLAAVAPARSPLTEAVQRARGLPLPYAPAPHGEHDTPAGAFWAQLTPLLALADRIGLLSADPDAVQAAADRLDDAATRFGPAADTYRNPAKTLAAELADSLPLLWGTGPLATAVAHRFAALLTSRAGRPALAAALPGAVTEHGALLAGPAGGAAADDDLDDFFRDRVEDADPLRARVVLLREPGDPAPATDPARTAQQAADRHGTPLSRLDAPPGGTTEALAELLALTDFTTVYLALAPALTPA